MSNFGIKDTCEIKLVNSDTGKVFMSGNTNINTEDYNDGYTKGYNEGKEDTERMFNNNIQELVSGLRDLKSDYLQMVDNACLCDSYYDEDDEEETLCPYCIAVELIEKYSK